jgi:hypothetical protein
VNKKEFYAVSCDNSKTLRVHGIKFYTQLQGRGGEEKEDEEG